MYRGVNISLYSLFAAILSVAVFMAPAQANGPVGEHTRDLQAHIDEYEQEVNWLLDKVDGIIETYATDGAKAAEPAKLVDHWEAVKVHAAIETNYVPVYASIWQGLYGIKQAIEEGKPVAEVREQQNALAQALWQGLGAVKLAAKQQTDKPAQGAATASGPVEMLKTIQHNLDKVVAKYAEKKFADAKDLLHESYASRFEGVEGALIEQDAELVEDLEKDFNVTLPQQLNRRSSMQQIRQIVRDMQGKLDQAIMLLTEAEQDKRDVF